jgi:hypothetical protein
MHQNGALISAKFSKKNFWGRELYELVLAVRLKTMAWGSRKMVHRNIKTLPPFRIMKRYLTM